MLTGSSLDLDHLPYPAFLLDGRTDVILARNDRAAALGLLAGGLFKCDALPEGWREAEAERSVVAAADEWALVVTGEHGSDRYFACRINVLSPERSLVMLQERTDAVLAHHTRSGDQGTDHTLQFLATMSHEMRTPLNGILGMADLLMGTGLDLNQTNFANHIKQSGVALLDLINAILDYAKLDTGQATLRTDVFEPAKLIEGVVEMLAPKAEQKGIEVAAVVDPSMPLRLEGDVSKLRQMLTNLVANAVKFTETGGVIVRARLHRTGDNHCDLCIDVQDTGIGIPQTLLPSIFDAYSRADTVEKHKIEGTGLGLAIVKQLARKMGGAIEVRSEEDEGSVFSLRVPLVVKDEAAPIGEVVGEERVVVLTRNRLLGEALGEQLTLANAANVAICHTAEEAEYALLAKGETLFLCDRDCAEDARELARLATRSIALLTPATRLAFDELQGFGFEAYMTKPIRLRSFCRVLAGEDLSITLRELEQKELAAKAARDCPALDILLAEDNEINAILARAVIERGGHRLTVVGDGLAAMEAARNKAFDLILMDMHMPKASGLDAAKAIRASEVKRRVPIIALTANALQEDQDACFAAGMDDFLSKPFEPDTLLGLIARYAGQAEASSMGDERAEVSPSRRSAPSSVARR
ncbi:MAG: ATP-binding protein [Parvularcula sp.]|jgi:signal transduction histidine kinase/CheY-like chemotaxis protein|nr:ATP-binding protein [Parvularcula sp.]